MKKVMILIVLAILSVSYAQAQSTEADSLKKDSARAESKKRKTIVDVTASIKNQHYWRGYAVGPGPVVTAMASVIGKRTRLEIGTWNGYGLDGIFKDVDMYVAWSKKGFSVAVWDVFNYSDYSASPGFTQYGGNHMNDKYFDYDQKTTRHFIDASVSYTIPKTNLSLFFATIVHGRDRNTDGTSAYSSYAKASYGFKTKDGVSVTPYLSYGFAFNGKNSYTFWQWTNNSTKTAAGFNEIGINFSKAIKISNTYSVTASAGVVASPVNNTVNGLFGITLF